LEWMLKYFFASIRFFLSVRPNLSSASFVGDSTDDIAHASVVTVCHRRLAFVAVEPVDLTLAWSCFGEDDMMLVVL
jgi:hypothetical protein